MKAIKRVSLSEQVLDSILKYVKEHGIRVGDQLPTEAEFATMLGVSRTSVREAMKALSINKAIESIPGKGTFARPALLNIIMDGPSELVGMAKATISQIMEVRTALEVLAVELAIDRSSDEDLTLVREATEDLRQAILSGNPWAIAGTSFHIRIAELSKNPLLLKNVQMLSSSIGKYKDALFAANTDMELYMLEHQNILEALYNRDKKSARKAMIRHMEITETDLLHLVDSSNASLFLDIS